MIISNTKFRDTQVPLATTDSSGFFENYSYYSLMPEHVFIEKLSDQKVDTVAVFSAFADTPWSMLLDSADSHHPDSRFDILVSSPLVTFETKEGVTKITQDNDISYSDDDPLSLIQHHISTRLSTQKPKTHLPFTGGAVGYFSYDLGRYFENLPATARNDVPLPEMAVGIYDHAIVIDNQTHETWLIYHADEPQTFTDIRSLFTSPPVTERSAFSLTSSWQSNMNFDEYSAKFSRIKDYLLDGDCYQINLTQRFTAGYTGDEYAAYIKLRQHNKAPFSGFLRFDDFSVLSISPERFIQLQGEQIQTKPIKGTLPRGKNPEEDARLAQQLRASKKDQAENVMIVDLLRNDISRVSKPGSVKVPELFAVESFPAVHHLVSTVVGELDEENHATDLIRAAFPGGSITGAPKIRAMEIIEELEPTRRTVYCGSIGYISACGNMDTSITIRTLACYNQQIYCWAGGGIVHDSTVDSEYRETFDKVNKILPVLEEVSSDYEFS